MRDVIIEYISHRLSLKGSMIVCFDGRKIYHETLIEHISEVFHINEFVVDGYLSYCIFELDDDFSYAHWSLLKVPVWDVDLGGLYAGYDAAIEGDNMVVNYWRRGRNGAHYVMQDITPIVDLPIP